MDRHQLGRAFDLGFPADGWAWLRSPTSEVGLQQVLCAKVLLLMQHRHRWVACTLLLP